MCEFAIAWDKAPNVFGVKNIVVDNTAALNEEGVNWNDSLGCVGEHLLSIALHQRVIDVEDLFNLKVGDSFKLSHLIKKRTSARPQDPTSEDVDAMCDLLISLCCACFLDKLLHVRHDARLNNAQWLPAATCASFTPWVPAAAMCGVTAR